MNEKIERNEMDEMEQHCRKIKVLMENRDYETCKKQILELMIQYPDSAGPQNLYGILCEKKKDHVLAMKHFRAACALDPTYLPTRYNMEQYGNWEKPFFQGVYCLEDCKEQDFKKNGRFF